MLSRIKAALRGDNTPDEPVTDQRQLAAAALLVEAAMLDEKFDAAERQAVTRILTAHFELNEAACADLIAAAEEAHTEANHLLRYTRTIKDEYEPEDRIELIEMLWEVAYADGVLHDYEANLLRRVGGLIYVSDKDRGAAQKRVLARLGINGNA